MGGHSDWNNEITNEHNEILAHEMCIKFKADNNIALFKPTRYKEQVVAGTNYTFNGMCGDREVTIIVWWQAWNGGVQEVKFA